MACKPPVDYANPRDLGQVAAPLRDRLHTAIIDAPRGGLVLVSGRRSDYQQYLLRSAHGCRGLECDSGCKGRPLTARPGRSNHRNLGGEVAAGDMGGIDLQWLADNEDDYGLHRPVPGELWHFEVAGPARKRIIRFGAGGNPNEGHHWMPFGPGDVDGVRGSIYRRGGYDNEIAEYQIRLRKLRESGWAIPDVGNIDGIFGGSTSKTAKASTAFHVAVQGLQRYTRQEVWPKAEPFVGPRKIAMARWWTA